MEEGSSSHSPTQATDNCCLMLKFLRVAVHPSDEKEVISNPNEFYVAAGEAKNRAGRIIGVHRASIFRLLEEKRAGRTTGF